MVEDLMFDIPELSKTWPLKHWFHWKTSGGQSVVLYILLDYTLHIQPPGLSLCVLLCKNLAILTEMYKLKNKMDALHVPKNVMYWLCWNCMYVSLAVGVTGFYVALHHTDAKAKDWKASQTSGSFAITSVHLFCIEYFLCFSCILNGSDVRFL